MPHPSHPAPHSRQSRSKTPVNPRLDKKLAAYVIAASAAGVGSLAAAPSAEAKIVYTPVNIDISAQAPYLLDVNGDGVADFAFSFIPVNHAVILQVALEVNGNAVRANKRGGEAGALFHGAPIGPKQAFTSVNSNYGGVFMADAGMYSMSYSFGPWVNTTNRYLGLKFLINNEVHYGWARMSVPVQFERGGGVMLTGYAYETVPNKPLLAGEKSRPSANDAVDPTALQVPAPASATLGLLARGADGVAIWRREE